MRGGREWEERGGGPTEEERDWMREESAHPAEVALYIAVAIEPRITFSRERAGEEYCEE